MEKPWEQGYNLQIFFKEQMASAVELYVCSLWYVFRQWFGYLFSYIDLARATSEALDNIYGLFKQNIKSCNAKRRRQRRKMVKNNKQ